MITKSRNTIQYLFGIALNAPFDFAQGAFLEKIRRSVSEVEPNQYFPEQNLFKFSGLLTAHNSRNNLPVRYLLCLTGQR